MEYRPLDYFLRAEDASKRDDLDAEIDTLKELVSLCQLSGEPTDYWAEALRWIGNAYQTKNDLPRAHSYRLEALKIVEQLGDRCSDYIAMCVFGDVGLSFIELKEWQEAELHTRRALAIAESRRGQDEAGVCIYRMNLSLILSDTGRLEEAIQLGELVLAEAESLDDPHKVLALQNLNLGLYHLQSNHLNLSAEHARRALVHADFCHQTFVRTKARKALGDSLLRAWHETGRRDYAVEAEHTLTEVVREARAEGDFSAVADTELELAELATARQHRDLADLHCVQAIEALEKTHSTLGFEEFSLKFFSDWDETYNRVAQVQLRRDNPAAAFLTSERSRGRLLLARLGSGNTDKWSEADRDQRKRALDHYGTAVIASCRAESTGGRGMTRTFGLRARNGTVSTEPSRVSDARAEFLGVQDRQRLYTGRWSNALMSPAAEHLAIQRCLGPCDAMISFHVCESAVVVFVLTRDEFHFQHVPYPRARLAAEIQDLCDLTVVLQDGSLEILQDPALRREWLLREPGKPHPAGIQAPYLRLLGLLSKLYTILIVPVLCVADSKTNWIIVPHGPLHRVPWAALWTGSEYVVRRRYVAVQPSASFAHALSQRNPASDGGKALLLGAPDPIEDEFALPGATAELWAAAAALGLDEPPDVGGLATKDAFLRKAPSARVIHLAAHHFFDASAAGLGFLKLSGDRGACFLYACEIAEMKLAAQLAVLSACETSRSRADTGDEQYGMVRSFLAAGARSIVSTLWAIEDASAARLFAEFYWRALEVPLIEALGDAQRAIMGQSPYDLPYFWAPYILSGDWDKRLQLEAP